MKRLMVAVAVLALTASGCNVGADSKIAVPKAGQCVASQIKDGDDVAPNVATVTSCRKPHSYEITAVVDIPKKYLVGGSAKKQLARRTELAIATASKQTSLGKKFQAQMGDICNDALFTYLGVKNFTIGGKAPSKAGLELVVMGADQWINLTSPGLWKKGDQRVICSSRYYDTQDTSDVPAVATITSRTTKTVMSQYLSDTFPSALRYCRYQDQAASCSSTHDTEFLWTFNASDVESTVDEKTLTKACNASYEATGFSAGDGQTVVAQALSGAASGYTPYACVLQLSTPATSWSAFGAGASV